MKCANDIRGGHMPLPWIHCSFSALLWASCRVLYPSISCPPALRETLNPKP